MAYYIKHWFSPALNIKEDYFYSEKGWTTDVHSAIKYCCGDLPYSLPTLKGDIAERRGPNWYIKTSSIPILFLSRISSTEPDFSEEDTKT